VNQVIRINSDIEKMCDFTEKKIKRKEPHILLANEFVISLDSSEDAYKMIKNREDGRKVLINKIQDAEDKEKRRSHYCESCKKWKTEKITMRRRYNGIIRTLCFNCTSQLLNKLKNIDKKVENSFYKWSERGICIRLPDYPVRTMISNTKVEDSYIMNIGCDLNFELSNIKKVKRGLENPTKKNISDAEKVFNNTCKICGDKVKDGHRIRWDGRRYSPVVTLHDECRENIITSINETLKEDYSFITSVTL
jgi:hypothetical protein